VLQPWVQEPPVSPGPPRCALPVLRQAPRGSPPLGKGDPSPDPFPATADPTTQVSGIPSRVTGPDRDRAAGMGQASDRRRGARYGASPERSRAQGARAAPPGQAAPRDRARLPKKSRSLLCQRRESLFGLILAERANYPVALMCRCVSVSRSAFYAWASKQRPTAKEVADASLVKQVREAHARSRRTYVSPASRPHCVGNEPWWAVTGSPGSCAQTA
jgi:hypothetical protein